MPPTMINVHTEGGQFLCKAHGLLFQGCILVYDPTHDAAECAKFKGITSDLLMAEEVSASEMMTYVPIRKESTELCLD